MALKSAPKPSARNIPSKETLPPPAETATIAVKAVIAPTTVSHCRKARRSWKKHVGAQQANGRDQERQFRQQGRKFFQQWQGRKRRYGYGCHDSSYGVALVPQGTLTASCMGKALACGGDANIYSCERAGTLSSLRQKTQRPAGYLPPDVPPLRACIPAARWGRCRCPV